MISPIHLSKKPHHITSYSLIQQTLKSFHKQCYCTQWFPSLQLKQKDMATAAEVLLWATQRPQQREE